MKTVITVIALVISNGLSLAQGMYTPLDEPNDSDTSFYINEVWYKDPVGNIHAFANDDAEGQEFLTEVLELFQIDRKSPTRVLKEGKTTYYYYKTPAAEEFRFYISRSIPNEPYIGIQITLNQ
jgi:hypothetical protein